MKCKSALVAVVLSAAVSAFAAKVKCSVFSDYPFGHAGLSLAFDFTRPLTITPDGVLEMAPLTK